MTTKENAFIRARAKVHGTSINDAIATIIQGAMAPYGEPPAPPQSDPEPKKPAAKPRGRGRRDIADLAQGFTPPPADPTPGQTAITDDDQ